MVASLVFGINAISWSECCRLTLTELDECFDAAVAWKGKQRK
jgi:hypothetical protein